MRKWFFSGSLLGPFLHEKVHSGGIISIKKNIFFLSFWTILSNFGQNWGESDLKNIIKELKPKFAFHSVFFVFYSRKNPTMKLGGRIILLLFRIFWEISLKNKIFFFKREHENNFENIWNFFKMQKKIKTLIYSKILYRSKLVRILDFGILDFRDFPSFPEYKACLEFGFF